MEYSKIVEELQKASLFDLYRLRVAMIRLLEDPERLEDIRAQLKAGQDITYFDAVENRDIEDRVIKLKRTRMLFDHKEDQERWDIPFYYVNINKVDTNIKVSSSNRGGIDKNELKLGDRVGFRDNQNNDLYGEVIRLNPKTATVIMEDNSRWRVPYRLLYDVIEGEGIIESRLIEGEVIKRNKPVTNRE